jgi:hypothetical protein
MVVNELKLIFVHIPKCAGVSLTHGLIKAVTGEHTEGQIGHLDGRFKKQFAISNIQKHRQAKDMVKEFDVSNAKWKQYFKFAIVRNPWDRIVSEYAWRHSLGKRLPPKNFSDFITYCSRRIYDPLNVSNDIYWPHAQTQWSFCDDGHDNMIVDTILKFEEMDKNIQYLSEKFDIDLASNITQRNSSDHDHYRTYYNERDRKRVEHLYKKDIMEFGYEF